MNANTQTQKQAQHTAGHWQQCLGSFGPYIVAQSPGKDVTIAKLHYSMTPDVESEAECAANCRLMAAAPELLAALREIVETPDAGRCVDTFQAIARNAIARATNTQS